MELRTTCCQNKIGGEEARFNIETGECDSYFPSFPEGYCILDEECPNGFKCYNSQLCSPSPNGIDCEQQLGDLRCHKICETNVDCSVEMPRCEEKEFFKGDILEHYFICVS